MALHKSDSSVQTNAEIPIIKELSRNSEYKGIKPANKEKISVGEAFVEVDAIIKSSNKITHVFEIYSRIGKLNSGSNRKISQDILKLILIKQNYPTIKTTVVLIDKIVESSLTKWVKMAAETFNIEIIVTPIEELLKQQIKNKQKDQYR